MEFNKLYAFIQQIKTLYKGNDYERFIDKLIAICYIEKDKMKRNILTKE